MGALDKLNNRIQQDEKKDTVSTEKTGTGTIGNRIIMPVKPEEKEQKEKKEDKSKTEGAAKKKQAAKKTTYKKTEEKSTAENKPVISSKEVPKSKPEKVVAKKMGRKPTRGIKDVDYKMLNIAVPMEVYEKLMASYGGNLTYHINSILQKAVSEAK